MWTLKWPMNLLQSLGAEVQEPLKNTNLDNHTQTKELLWKSRNLVGKFQNTSGLKLYEIRYIGKDSKKSSAFITLPLPQGTSAQYQESPSQPMIPPVR